MKEKSCGEFQSRALDAAWRGRFPLRALIELTYRCNFRCRHCYVPDGWKAAYRRREMTTAQVSALMDSLRAAGCLVLGFTGGEPFLRHDIFAILRRAVKLGFQVVVNTNGSLIDAKAARRLGRIGLNKIDITLPAVSPDIFDSVTGRAGSAGKVFRALRLLRQQNVPAAVKTCVLAENAAQARAVARYARMSGLAHRVDELPFRRLDGSPVECCPGPGTSGARRVSARGKMPVFFCGAGTVQCAITPAGELKFCAMTAYPLLPVFRLGFGKAWKMLNNMAESIRPDGIYCGACSLQPQCKGCPARVWLEKKVFAGCAPEHKRLAANRRMRPAARRADKEQRHE
ncbi:MAG: radical SAM protein [Elusimicrobiales bacterium]